MIEAQPNFVLSGDEARILMLSMLKSDARVPIGQSLELYFKLSTISTVQPAKTEETPT